jgi:hypothetical protein
MKWVITIILTMATVAVFVATKPGPALSTVCFLSHEYESGMNKICVYDCVEGQAAITIKSYRVCPITIDR